jgi:hypothetical protein
VQAALASKPLGVETDIRNVGRDVGGGRGFHLQNYGENGGYVCTRFLSCQ